MNQPGISVDPMQPGEELLELVRNTRELYEQILAQSIDTRETAGTCFYACVLLYTAIRKFTPFSVTVRGGDGIRDGGYLDFSGRRHGHYWLEVVQPDGAQAWVVDLTADQFGGPPVTVLPLQFSRPRYVPGDQATVDAHVLEHGPRAE